MTKVRALVCFMNKTDKNEMNQTNKKICMLNQFLCISGVHHYQDRKGNQGKRREDSKEMQDMFSGEIVR